MTSRILSLLGVLVFVAASPVRGQAARESIELFEEVWRLCREHFYSPMATPDWESLERKYKPLVEQAASEPEAAAAINAMLSELKASHTRLYTRSDWEYYDLLDIFKEYFAQQIRQLFPEGKAACPSIGLFTRKLQGKTFVKAVLDGSPAAKAGILAGDEIRSVDGAEYDAVESFAAKRAVTVRIQRKPEAGSEIQFRIAPEHQTPGERYLNAMRASARIIRNSGYNVGYAHVWSFAGEEYYLELIALIREGSLKAADALILDLRDGWGGANSNYLSPFDPQVPTEMPSDDGKYRSIPFKWRRPVVFLVNEGTRSGKETLTYNFKRRKLGVVVGATTAGADAAGMPFLLKGGGLLMLSVKPRTISPQVPEADRIPPGAIEEKGVPPDILVEFPLEYAAGNDPQLQAAVQAAVKSVKNAGTPRE